MTGFRILIRAFTARRDVMHSMILARLLENDGNEVIVSSIRQFEFAVKFWKPHAIIFNIQGLSEYLLIISVKETWPERPAVMVKIYLNIRINFFHKNIF